MRAIRLIPRVLAIAAAAALLLAPLDAQAASITGSISFGGSWTPVDSSNNTTTIAAATGVDITSNTAVVTCALFLDCQGSYSGLNGNLIGATYNDFQFSPSLSTTDPLWSFDFPSGTTYSFTLTSATVTCQDTGACPNELNLTGSGILHITGLDDTPGIWTFTGSSTLPGTFSFESTNAATAVPEPGLLTLFGLGLLGVGRKLARRKV